jgi:hypothetical protein
MDGIGFDRVVRVVGALGTRRAALRAALGGAALIAGGAGTAAKKRKKRCRCTPRGLGQACTANKQCCTDKTNRICFIKNDDMTEVLRCCGALGAGCGTSDDCCNGFGCEGGACQPAP